MKYTSLENDIIDILHSSDYNLTLKFYDVDGLVTTEPEDVKWCYVKNRNIMIEMMDDDNSVITIWKENEDVDNNKDKEEIEDFKKIIQRIRELAVLNGVSVQIKIYNDLDRRKIYNIVKNEIKKQEEKEDEMVESFTLLNKKCKDVRKPSEFYLSEELHLAGVRTIIENLINEFNSLDKENKKYSKYISSFLTEDASLIEEKVNSIKENNEELYNSLLNTIPVLNDVFGYVKNKYLKNTLREVKEQPKALLYKNNLKLYEVNETTTKDNLYQAYNHLISVSKDAKSGYDILRAIKNNNLCETYRVSKNDLLDLWLSKTNDIKIEPKKVYVIETVDGNKMFFNTELKYGIKTIADYINNGGSNEDKGCKYLISETLKLNTLSDFIANHISDINVKDKVSTIKKLFTECFNNIQLRDNYDNLILNENCDVDYSKYEAKLEQKFGFSHPAIKYIAIEEAKNDSKNQEYQTILERRDDYTLRNCLLPLVSLKKAVGYSHSIIKNKLNVFENVEMKTETNDDWYNFARKLYENVHTVDTDTNNIVKTYLFSIINQPRENLTEEKIRFLKTIKKYIK